MPRTAGHYLSHYMAVHSSVSVCTVIWSIGREAASRSPTALALADILVSISIHKSHAHVPTEVICMYLVQLVNSFHFYRAMHYSAKRGLAITCRLSARLGRWWIMTT